MTLERLENGFVAYTAPEFRFQSDAMRLAAFALPSPGERVCDLGTGCGCIPLTWYARGVDSPVDGIDVQREAVALAARSAAENGWSDRLRFFCRDWRQPGPEEGYDRVVCNPPYFAAGQGRAARDERRKAARWEEEPFGWVTAAAIRLRHGGRLCCCWRPERLADLLAALRAERLEPKRLRLVQNRADTPPWLVLCEARKGARPGLTIEPVWIEEDEV
ncbi:MAG: tRNA1(Val) (adenine(37)-N6)-methyltransferase [Acutalibacteraceae bacterium]|jgi:tRNA1Val (adenine37-N6)-methyltransferase